MADSDFIDGTAEAAGDSAQLQEGGQKMQKVFKKITDFLQSIQFPIFISFTTIQVACCSLYFLSTCTVICVLTTNSRKFKNIAHISWSTSVVTFTISCIFIAFYAAFALLFNDICSVFDDARDRKTTRGLTAIWPDEISNILD